MNNRLFLLSFCLVCFIVYIPISTGGFEISDLNPINVFTDAVCATLASKDIAKCANQFKNELDNVNDQPFKELQYRKYCCSFNHLKSCITDAIGDKCGNEKDSVVNKILLASVSTVKLMSGVNCETYSGTSGSVLCLNDFLLIGLTIGLIVLFLIVCGAVCRGCGSGGRRGQRDSTHFHLLPQNKRY